MSKLVPLNTRMDSDALELFHPHPTYVCDNFEEIHSHQIDRQDLIARIQSQLDKRIIYITAALGSGKSTLLSEAFSVYSPVVFELTPEDCAAKSFFSRLTQSIQQLDPTFSAYVLVPAQKHKITQYHFTTAMYIAEINRVAERYDTPFIIILDDLHHMQGANWTPLLEYIIQATVNVIWVISSEYRHTLSLTTCEAADELFRLGEKEMYLTVEETASFLNQSAAEDRSLEVLEAIRTRNGCWPYGVGLANTFLQKSAYTGKLNSDFSSASPTLNLADRLIQQMPQDVKHFIEASAFLDRFNAELCQFVLNSADCAAPIEALESLNCVLIKENRSALCYRYHPVLHEHLKLRTELLPDNVKNQLVARACRWLMEHQFIAEAFEAAANHSHPLFVSEIQHRCLIHWIKQSDIESVFRWQKHTGNPVLKLSEADRLSWFWALTFSGQIQAAQIELTVLLRSLLPQFELNPEQAIERLFTNPENKFHVFLAIACTALENMKAPLNTHTLNNLKLLRKNTLITPAISTHIENILAHHYSDRRDFLRAQHHLGIALREAKERNDFHSITVSTYTQARMELLNCNLTSALETCNRHLCNPSAPSGKAGYLLIQALRAKILYYGTSPQLGLREAHKLVESNVCGLNRDGLILTFIPILHDHLRNDRFDQAESVLIFLEHAASQMSNQALRVQVVLERFRSALLQGDLLQIEKWVNLHQLPAKIAQCLDSGCMMEWSTRENWILCGILYHISQDRFTEASRLTGQLLYLNIECGFQIRYLPISMLQAWLEYRKGCRSTAFFKLNQILTQAEIFAMGFGLFDIIPDASEFIHTALENERIESPAHRELLHQLGY